MRNSGFTPALLAALLLAGCGDASGPEGVIRLQDNCDPITFDAALGAGACRHSSGALGLTLADFTAGLQAHHAVAAWKIAPDSISVSRGTEMALLNTGGETHTYTEVEEFGGGVVQVMNELSGNPSVAPECVGQAAFDASAVRSGQMRKHIFAEVGTEKYQCCIHPWMRQTVTVF